MSVQDLITKYTQWESSSIKYGPVKTNSRGGKSIPILDKNGNNLTLRFPLTFCWGINENEDESSGRKKYSVSIQYPSEGFGTKGTNLIFQKMKEFQEAFINDAVSNSKEWFNKKMSREVVEALCCPMLKYPYVKGTKDPDYSRSPTTTLKIGFYEGVFNIKIHDMAGNNVFGSKTELGDRTFDSFIPKGSHIAPIVQCKGVWFVGGKFGVSFQIVQTMVKLPIRIQDHDECLIELDDDEKEELNNLKKKDEKTAQEQTKSAYGLDDDDEEEEIDDVAVEDSDADETVEGEVKQELEDQIETEPEPEPEKPKRKRVKKKVMATKTA